MNILYIGSSGALSLLPFKKLLASSYSIDAVGVYRPIAFNKKIITLQNESLALAANQHDIPVIDLSLPVEQVVKQCQQLSIDLILMSCYGKRLADELVSIATLGCFNMHPSLLPEHRGCEPIFWQMKQAGDIGVSWHRVVHDFDAGDIVAQQKVNLFDGESFAEINVHLANAGAKLMLTMLTDLSEKKLANKKQDATLSSYQSYPSARDFIVDTSWSARRAYNFMRATSIYGHPYLCRLDTATYVLDKALDYENNDSLQEVQVQADRLYIPCNEGVLIARFTGKL